MIPDRFSNGDPSNDIIAGYRDQTRDRKDVFPATAAISAGPESPGLFQTLGVTALWLTPIVENNTDRMRKRDTALPGIMATGSPTITKIDRRLGGNEGVSSVLARPYMHRVETCTGCDLQPYQPATLVLPWIPPKTGSTTGPASPHPITAKKRCLIPMARASTTKQHDPRLVHGSSARPEPGQSPALPPS